MEEAKEDYAKDGEINAEHLQMGERIPLLLGFYTSSNEIIEANRRHKSVNYLYSDMKRRTSARLTSRSMKLSAMYTTMPTMRMKSA